MMNSRPITVAIAPAVCLTIAPMPNARIATSVTNSAQPMIASSTVDGWITSMPENCNVILGRPAAPTRPGPGIHVRVLRDGDGVEQ